MEQFKTIINYILKDINKKYSDYIPNGEMHILKCIIENDKYKCIIKNPYTTFLNEDCPLDGYIGDLSLLLDMLKELEIILNNLNSILKLELHASINNSSININTAIKTIDDNELVENFINSKEVVNKYKL